MVFPAACRISRSLAIIVVGAFLLIAIGAPLGVADAAPGRRVTRVLIKKQEHSLQLLAATGTKGEEELVASYRVAIGPGGPGPKEREGDMTTPVGRYHVTLHQPSQYTIFLRLDYPTPADYRRFNRLKERGELPKDARIGGDIGIHGPPVAFPNVLKAALKSRDWTAGCIAVDEDEITEIAKRVPDGTVVDIEE